MTSQDLQRRMMGTSASGRLRLALVAAEHLERMGQRIRERREELGLSRADVARAMPGKTNENAIYRWEKGLHRISDDTLDALAKVLKVSSGVYFMVADGVKNTGTPDLSAAGQDVEERLAQLADQLAADRQDREESVAEVKALLRTQNENLQRQTEILAELKALLATQQAAARHLEKMTEEAVKALPAPPVRRAARKAPTGTSLGS